MTELLPTRQAADLRRAITDYVSTAISLADPSVAGALDAFLTGEDTGIFLGPYLRTRLPFAAPAAGPDARELVPSLPAWFEPYAHQAQAFARLSSVPDLPGAKDQLGFRLPEPSIVTTGTGSGKTESFLFPVLDHIARARRAGVPGMKALILYPMNALANDQADRLARLITDTPAYRGITAALYTGEASATPSTTVTADGLITDREFIRGSVPDIVLTNYKMLDQLLLRRADRPLWEHSARSLRYLVLDEFHTYDGAQGTDVAMLLRRLHLVLDRIAPGAVHVTPVATSATLGDGEGAAGAMLDFASTVFGTEIVPDAVITETRVPLDEFVGPARTAIGRHPSLTAVTPLPAAMQAATADHQGHGEDLDPVALGRDVLDALWTAGGDEAVSAYADGRGIDLRDLLVAHPLTRTLLAETARAHDLADLTRALFPLVTDDEVAQGFTTAMLAVVSHVRAAADRNEFPSLEAHLWVREISRVDRLVQTAPAFRWSDAAPEDGDLGLPAVYCRHCGRSGWGATTRAVGDDLDLRPDTIRKDAVDRNGRFRALLLDVTAPGETEDVATEESSRRRWLDLASATLARRPIGDGADDAEIRVLVHAGLDADERSNDGSCPACGERDGIRFLGTRLATLLSVTLTSLFGTPGLDLADKKALVFTDSVQDAAHRAGFVEARSYSLTMRSVVRAALTTAPQSLGDVVARMLDAADTDERRYRLLHPAITDTERLEPFWHQDPERRRGTTARSRARATELVTSRLLFDIGLELGLTGQVGRTLLLTGSAVAGVRVTDEELDAAADRALGTAVHTLFGDDCATRRRWVRGVLERLRTHGAIGHPWLVPFRRDGGPVYRLWGGRPQPDVMPAFPTGRALPHLPSIGHQGSRSEFEDATSRSGWYADWAARCLTVDRGTASALQRALFDTLVDLDVLDVVDGTPSVRSFALRPERIEASLPGPDDDAGTPALVCRSCREVVTGTPHALEQLVDGPCPRFRCPGLLRPQTIDATYYRALYRGDMRRVVAREHTSLLTTQDRLTYETEFKGSATTPGAPNVLVATPTLEMGIDIGDLSTVLLASVPRTVASYLQRVGRAGRRTGNALDVTFVAGRGRAAGAFHDPLDLLNGTVRAPGAYLSAQEILHRQFLASVLDTLAGDDRITPPSRTTPVLRSVDPGTFLGHVLAEMDARGPVHVERFLARFSTGAHAWDGLTQEARDELAAWASSPGNGEPSGLETTVREASMRWNAAREELFRRRRRVQENLADLEKLPSTEERAESVVALRAEDLLITQEAAAMGDESVLSDEERETERRRLRGSAGRIGAEASAVDSEHWIGVLERYGLLPNFTLVDDAVTLDATVIWQDDDGQWKHEAIDHTRSGAAALTELAPGAHFYAHGRDLVVDAVDIGVDGAALSPTAFCPRCGHAEEFPRGRPPTMCPVCRAGDIADPGQQRDVVDLTRVYSTMHRSRTRIGDAREDRERVRFETALSLSLHGATPLHQWSVEGTGLGMQLHRGTTLTRLNLGRPHQVAEKIRISGEDCSAPGFLVCAECGHHDSDTAGNRRQDHQAWCSLRSANESDNRAALLSRTVRTETVLITLPRDILEDPSGELLPHVIAALELGIETRFGGSVGNVDVDVVAHPTHHGHRAVLLSDAIVGGTGYLLELASPRNVWDLLVTALEVLLACPCQDEGLAACHRCLLPYVRPSAYADSRRSTAIEAVRMLLADPTPTADAMTWTVREREAGPATASESPLEQRFRRAFIAAMEEIEGADVSVSGATVSVRNRGRTFTLTPQVDVAGSRPDFVLTWQGADVGGIAIFTDGLAYHATVENNRVADDAVKRMRLRDAGYVPLVVTHQDVERATRRGDEEVTRSLPSLLVRATVGVWTLGGARNQDVAHLLDGTPLDLLADVVRTGTTAHLRHLAQELPQFLVDGATRAGLTSVPPDEAQHVAGTMLDGTQLPPTGTDPQDFAIARRSDQLAVVAHLAMDERRLTLVLDDRDGALREDSFAEAWRTWGRLANLAQGDPHGSTVHLTTVRLLTEGLTPDLDPARRATPTTGIDVVPTTEPTTVDPSGLPPAWRGVYQDAFTDTEREVVLGTSGLGIEPPVIGDEFGPGIPVDIAWPDRKVAVFTEEPAERERTALEAEGWKIVTPVVENVVDALRTAGDQDS